LAGMLGLGYAPSGSEDPYALRRAANAIIQVLFDRGYRLSLTEFARRAMAPLKEKLKGGEEEALGRILEFLRSRVAAALSRNGAGGDLVEAILSAGGGTGWHDPVDARARLRTLARLESNAETFEPLTTTFKRVTNIIRQAAEEGGGGESGGGEEGIGAVSADLLTEKAERALEADVRGRSREVEETLAEIRGLPRDEGGGLEDAYGRVMANVTALRPAVDAFFDEVLVMAEDEGVRRNRLALLAAVGRLFTPVADFSKIKGRPPRPRSA
ncbi:MAG: glycine--tRNA ligase subunit beta, partial [bacterium]